MVNLGFGSLRTLEGHFGEFGFLDWMYTRVVGRTLMFVVEDICRGALDVRLQIVHERTLGTTRTYATFWNTPWIIPRRTLQPLVRCVNSIKRTLHSTQMSATF
jgi:hypothetical protein